MTVAERADLSTSAISPNELPGPSVPTASPLHGDLCLAARDDEEVEAVDTFGRDRRALGEMALDELAGESLDGLVVEVGEEGHAADELG